MKNDTVDNPNYANIDEYKMLSFDDRVTHGLRMDRSFFNHNPIFDLNYAIWGYKRYAQSKHQPVL